MLQSGKMLFLFIGLLTLSLPLTALPSDNSTIYAMKFRREYQFLRPNQTAMSLSALGAILYFHQSSPNQTLVDVRDFMVLYVEDSVDKFVTRLDDSTFMLLYDSDTREIGGLVMREKEKSTLVNSFLLMALPLQFGRDLNLTSELQADYEIFSAESFQNANCDVEYKLSPNAEAGLVVTKRIMTDYCRWNASGEGDEGAQNFTAIYHVRDANFEISSIDLIETESFWIKDGKNFRILQRFEAIDSTGFQGSDHREEQLTEFYTGKKNFVERIVGEILNIIKKAKIQLK